MSEATILYTIPEIAEKLRVKEITVRRLIASRQLASSVVGRQYRISEQQLREYLVRFTIQPVEKPQ